jgi:hypothetical protein
LALQASNIYRELRQLRTSSRKLIALLIQNPPVPYAEISARLGIPVGSIGPSRSHCLDKLRRDPAIAALINVETANAGVDINIQPTAQSGPRDQDQELNFTWWGARGSNPEPMG